MKSKILLLMMITVFTLSLAACGKQKDTGFIVSVGDNNNDTGKNDLTAETNDVVAETESEEVVEEVTEKPEESNANKDIEYMIDEFISLDGDVYEFDAEGNFSCYLVDSDVSLDGTYETDGKTFMTVKYIEEDFSEDEDEDEDTTDDRVVRSTIEPSEDGKSTVVTEYDAEDNIVNQYTINEAYQSTIDTNNSEEEAELIEMTYKLTKTTTTNEEDEVIEVVVLSKGDKKIILYKD